jgi:hypothetical protein
MKEERDEPRLAEGEGNAPEGSHPDERTLELIEHGEVSFFARPRVQLATVRSFSDVQKLAMVLQPRGRDGFARRIHIGRKRMPDSTVREREWAYVDRIGDADELTAELERSKTYLTKTRGERRQSGGAVVARGAYGIVTHGTHVHLVTRISEYADNVTDMLLHGLRIVPRGSYIAAVFNPESKWRIRNDVTEDVPFREPSIFGDDRQERFGNRRFAPLAPDLIDEEGAELVLIGGCKDGAPVTLLDEWSGAHG